ncbi:MAG: nucleotidyltransferase family protein [Alphaproteobacteria bacterium]|nr:nucleotidyltransferase family protein [Alphaproteobacteria bacterium]
MSRMPKHAMVLAAGLGLRMRPITEKLPKPLIEVAGRTLLDRALDRLEDAGIESAVVNVHYLGAAIERHLKRRANPAIAISREADLLETGGGVRQALDHFGGKPFFVVNSDITWLDGPRSALKRLADAWDDERMDALLLVNSVAKTDDYDGSGDFFLSPSGRLRRRKRREIAPFLFTGVQILHPRLFRDSDPERFSLNVLYDRAEQEGRLHGLVHDGVWFHIGTPSGLAIANRALPPARRRAKAG